MSSLVERELRESGSVISSIAPKQVVAVAKALISAFRQKRKAVFFGNGGSAADAQHLAAEFSGRYLMDRESLHAVALINVSSITGIGNDYNYDSVFERQIGAIVTEGDVVVGMSTSGNSKNVLKAIERAKKAGAVTIAFTGSGGKLKDAVDIALTVPSTSTPRIQEGYMAAGHAICGLVEKGLFGRRAVFVDRDNTIAKDVPYCSTPQDFHLFPGVGASIRRLNQAGFLVIVITNQSGVARGYFSEEALHQIHDKMKADLARDGGRVDAVYYCPHLPEAGCECRKPRSGMIEQALKEFDIDVLGSFVIGDSEHDIELGKRIGARSICVDQHCDFNQAVDRVLASKD
jgi:D-sedoheptulose 7-phosphate isomerase